MLMGPGTKTLSKPAQGVRVRECQTQAEQSAQWDTARKVVEVEMRGRERQLEEEMLKERGQERRRRGKEWEMRKGGRGRREKRRI